MARDDSSGGWLPVGGGGLSQVSVCRVRGARPEGGARQGHYVIHGERLRDQKGSHPGAGGGGGGGGGGKWGKGAGNAEVWSGHLPARIKPGCGMELEVNVCPLDTS